MPKINAFSDEPEFTIKTVCAQTGIRPVTLRAWERRHEVLTPHRSENRYRLYSKRDVAILRWIKNRVDSGVAISHAVEELHGLTDQNLWPDALPDAPVVTESKPGAAPAETAHQLFLALSKHDEARAGELLRQAHATFDLNTALLKVVTPALAEIGEAWYRGEIRVATEHFASNFIRGRLLTLLQAYSPRRNAAYILVGGAPGELHEISGLMLSVMLRARGFRVDYLGPDIPIEDLTDFAKQEHPDMIILTASLEPAALELKHFQERLDRLRVKPIFGYGGRAFVFKPALCGQVPGIFLGTSLDEGVETVNGLLQQRVKTPARAVVL